MRKILQFALCAVLVAALLAAGTYAIKKKTETEEMRRQLESSMQASLRDAITGLRSAEADLSKLLIATDSDPARQLLQTLALKAAAAGDALAKLPTVAAGIQNTLKYANQLSSWCVTVSNEMKDGDALPEDFEKKVREFLSTGRTVNRTLSETEAAAEAGELSLVDTAAGNVPSAGSFASIAEDMNEYPAVIFDGPFSDGEDAFTPREDRPGITKEQAVEAARAFGVEASDAVAVDGLIPVWQLESGTRTLQLTKKGGLPLMLLDSRTVGEAQAEETAMTENAEAFVRRAFPGEHEIVWREDYGLYTVFNFVPLSGGVRLYPDLFKVKIASDDGSVLGLSAKSYVTKHTERTLPEASLGEAEARGKLKQGFSATEGRLALIPARGDEVLCWEFFGTFDEMKYAVYLSAEDGSEQATFRILETETGEKGL